MAKMKEEEKEAQKEEKNGRGREEETSRQAPRGLAIFQWDLLEHHSKALRPPGRASRLPSPWHFHLVPSHSTLSFGLRARREREKGLRGRDERSARLVSSPLISSRLVPSRLDAGRGHSSANYFILTPGPVRLRVPFIRLPPSPSRYTLGAPIV